MRWSRPMNFASWPTMADRAVSQADAGLPYWKVAAFSNTPSGGNPAAVMELEHRLDDTTFAAIARSIGLPATAFVWPAVGHAESGDVWDICWYSPSGEIALCGHATLAAGHILLGRNDALSCITFMPRKAGELTVRRGASPDCAASYEVALPVIATQPAPYPEAEAALGSPAQLIQRSADRYNIFLYDNEAAVRAVKPDYEALAALGNDQFICTAPGGASDVVSRVFAPGAGANEDSVTGSAHAALAPFWADRLARASFTAHQASERGGDLTLRLEASRSRVHIGGACCTISRAKLSAADRS